MLSMHDLPGAKFLGQVVVNEKSPESAPAIQITPVSAIVPTLVTVTDCAGLVFPTGSDGNVSLDGDSFTMVPVPRERHGLRTAGGIVL
jgi:hypothetical protein